MVATTERDGTTFYECEDCGMLFASETEAGEHEDNCDAEEPGYIQ
jgi:uncharacterized C2H2 Zn-finger protein